MTIPRSNFKNSKETTWKIYESFHESKNDLSKIWEFWLCDAELVSSGLESGPMPILLCKLCTHWAISSALYIIHLVQWWKRQKEVGTKSFRQMMMTTVHCLQHTYMTCHLFASFESILYPCIIVSDMTYILNWHWQHENWTRSCMSKS